MAGNWLFWKHFCYTILGYYSGGKKSQCDLISKQILSRIITFCTHTPQSLHVVMRDTVFKAEPQQSGLCFYGMKCQDKDLTLFLHFWEEGEKWYKAFLISNISLAITAAQILLQLPTSGGGGFAPFQRNFRCCKTWLKVTHLSSWHFSLHMHYVILKIFPRWGAVYGWKQRCGYTQPSSMGFVLHGYLQPNVGFHRWYFSFFQMKNTVWWWPFVPQIVSVVLQNSQQGSTFLANCSECQ